MSRSRSSRDNNRRQAAVQRAKGSAIDRFIPKTSRKFLKKRQWAAANRHKIRHSREFKSHNFQPALYRILTLSSSSTTVSATFSRIDSVWRCLSVDHPEIDWLRRIRNFDTLSVQIKQWISKHDFQMTWGPALSSCPKTLGQHPSKPSVELPVDCQNSNASSEDMKTEPTKTIIPFEDTSPGVASGRVQTSEGRRVMG